MSTAATSTIRNIKSGLPTSNSIHTITSNGNEGKSNGLYSKKPVSATNLLQNYSSTTHFNNHHLKKRTHFPNYSTKSLPIDETKQQNGYQSNDKTEPPSPPVVFHAIAPAPKQDELTQSTEEIHVEQKANHESLSESSRRIANVLAHTRIKTMSNAVSSSSDEEGESSLYRSHDHSISSIDTDSDESDHENTLNNTKHSIKSRRLLKTRKTSFSSVNNNYVHTPPISRTNLRKDESQARSSSNDDDKKETSNIHEEAISNNRRLKYFSLKKRDHILTTTTTDDDTTKHRHRYHALDNLEINKKNILSESADSSPIPITSTINNSVSIRKAPRFQVKSIRKSQQQQVLLGNTAAAKSSNDDDCSAPNPRTKFSSKQWLVERKHTNTPTTDGETSTTNTDQLVNRAVSTLNTVANGQPRVRFHVPHHKKHESPAEEERSTTAAATATTALPLPTPAPPSSAASAQGEDEEEEEAVAKSPDNRFIKYAKEIGRGAFKTVYRGLDTETSVAVAWCELQDFAQFDRQERARFKEEAEMLKKLQHQNIVRFYDFWEETNPRTNKKVIILVTELMTSGSLKGYIKNFKGQKEEKRINVMKKWCRQILKGLAYLHSRNPPVIHRDLKCDNVFISSTTGCVKIGDLGLATFKTQTFAKSMRGTMEFMAPEMFDEKYDELVDIYSFGLCMLEMITGEYPYVECKGPTAVIKRVTAGLKPDCYYKVESEDVREVIDCCIRTKKEERLSVHELLQHSFFLDDNSLRIELVRDSSNDSSVVIKNDTIDLKLKIVDKAKRKALYPDNKVLSTDFEAIRFSYNLNDDTPEKIADELIATNNIFEDDKKFVIQSIKDRLRAVNYEMLDRQAGVFSANGKTSINQTSQPTIIVQQQAQQQTPPIVSLPQPTNFPPGTTTTPPVIPQAPIEQQQQQQIVKPVVATEPTAINPIPDLNQNIPGSAGSLVELEAALKKTFNKTNGVQGTNATSTLVNDSSEPPTPLINQDDLSIPKPTPTTTVSEQPEEHVLAAASEPLSNTVQSSASTIIQPQSQPTVMPNNPQQQQMLQSSHLLSQTSQSLSYPTMSPPQHVLNNTIPNELIKQSVLAPASSSSATPTPPNNPSTATETIENYISISPSSTPLNVPHTSEAIQPAVPSDNQAQTFNSLQQLEVLLMNTFKKPNKTTGTAYSSDNEGTNTNISSIPIQNNEEKTEADSLSNEDEKKRLQQINISSQQSVSLPVQLTESTHFDPIPSTDQGNLQELEILLKSTFQKTTSNEESNHVSPQISSSNDELSELKSMFMDLSKTLITKMNIIETKIDDHCLQTQKINQMLTQTILPSLMDITEIMQETSASSNIDSRVRTKLQHIQTRIRTTQEEQQTEMRNLMDI